MTINERPFEQTQQSQEEWDPLWLAEKEERELEKRQRAQFSSVGLVAAAFMLVTMVAQIGMVMYVNAIDTMTGGIFDFFNSTGIMLMSAVPMYLIAFPVALALMQAVPKCREKPQEFWGLGSLLMVLVISLGIGLAGNLLGQAVEHFRPVSDADSVALEDMLLNSSVWINLLVTAVLAPVVEEFLFRKLLMDRLLGYGEWAAVLVSGLMFGMAHGNFGQFFYAFGIGLVWAYMYAKTGRISYTIVIHGIFNIIGGVMTTELSKGIYGGGSEFWPVNFLEQIVSIDLSQFVITFSTVIMMGYGILMLGCVIAGITLLIVFRRKIRFLPGIWPIKKGRMFRTVFINPGMILYFLVCAGFFLINW